MFKLNITLEALKRYFGIRSPSSLATRYCRDCRKHGTMECPNSFYCYSTDDKPHFEPK